MVGHEHVHAIGVAGGAGAFDASHELGGLCLGAVGDAGAVGNVLAWQVKHNRAVIDADDAVGSTIEIRRNVAREQHAALAVGDKGEQLIEQFLACHGIEARGGFVQNEQLGIVAERAGELQLHTHAAGEVLDLCLGIEAKSVDESGERFAVPRGVRRAYERLDLAHLERGGEGARVQDKTDAGA